jgi:universal stress protein E
MQRFTNVLVVPVTESPDVPAETAQAVELAAENGARLTAFGVIPQPSRIERLLRQGHHKRPVNELLEAGVRTTLSAWAGPFAEQLDIDVIVSEGHQSVEIVRAVLRADFDLVVMTTDGSDDALTTAKRVVRTCPCPVWIVRPGRREGPVVAAVDVDDEPGLNITILELAASQAQRRHSELHVVHAWSFAGESAIFGGDFVMLSGDAIEALRLEVEDAHRAALEGLLDSVALEPTPSAHLVEERPVRAIEMLADRVDASLVVMGAVGRGGIDGLLMGNTAERVLASSDRSVLVVKPPGFVSPVS